MCDGPRGDGGSSRTGGSGMGKGMGLNRGRQQELVLIGREMRERKGVTCTLNHHKFGLVTLSCKGS